MNDRLVSWTESLNLIPEFQAGFRRGMGCLDNLFVLMSTLQIHRSNPGAIVHAAFIDFKGAFPSINHQLLWNKLYSLGLSSKLINVMKDFYSKAYTCIKTQEGSTQMVKVTRGVLQGEILSPFEFLLYISDMQNFFIDRECRGISVDESTEVVMRGFADDYVLLADSPLKLKKKLDVLYDYCEINELLVNTEKTKIVILSKSSNSKAKKIKRFKFGESSIEVVKEYTYLGIIFHNSCSFKPAAGKAISAANTAVGSVLRTIYSVKTESWETCTKLFESLALSVLAYSCQIWGLNFLDLIEGVQLSFFKKLLNLPNCTLNYAVRIETGASYLALLVLKNTLLWLNKVLLMENSRIPKRCLMRFIKLSRFYS